MKKLLFVPLIFAVSFCNTAKTKKTDMAVTIESVCPDNGKCSVQLIKNKSVDIKMDGLGSTYYQLADDSSKSVVIYEYNRDVPEGLQDGQHKEEIIFEIDNKASEIAFSDGDLSNVKMLFGRHCFCRGQAGYFRVNKGSLKLTQKDNVVSFNLNFKVTEVPQLFTEVKAVVK